MGDYSKEQENIRLCEEYKKDFELRNINVKRLFNIPVVYVKQSKYEKVYSLFNRITIFRTVNFEGWY